MNQPDQLEQVRAALDTVTDPEIDEPVTTLEFVSSVEVSDNNDVCIEFRLPTYWCAPNFAFLMASDIRDAVAELSWVNGVSVRLLDHFSAEMINRGVALKQEFRDAFPGETDDDLKLIRQKFLGKAFERRQELLVRYLLARGYTSDWIRNAQLSDLMNLALDPEGASLRNLYLFMMRRLRMDLTPGAPAFVTLCGETLAMQDFKSYLRRIAGVRRNAEFNGLICRSLLSERMKRSSAEG
jgi:metal-sulfur cluster biosynthetic enzyme